MLSSAGDREQSLPDQIFDAMLNFVFLSRIFDVIGKGIDQTHLFVRRHAAKHRLHWNWCRVYGW